MLNFADKQGVNGPGISAVGVADSESDVYNSVSVILCTGEHFERGELVVCTDLVVPNTVTRTHSWK